MAVSGMSMLSFIMKFMEKVMGPGVHFLSWGDTNALSWWQQVPYFCPKIQSADIRSSRFWKIQM